MRNQIKNNKYIKKKIILLHPSILFFKIVIKHLRHFKHFKNLVNPPPQIRPDQTRPDQIRPDSTGSDQIIRKSIDVNRNQ